MRSGFTLLEVLLGLTITSVLLALILPRYAAWSDRIAVRKSSLALMSFYNEARRAAELRSTRVRIDFGPDTLRATLEGVADSTFLVRPVPGAPDVAFRVSRTPIRIYPNALGYGAANTKLVVSRGTAAESLTTSIRGRLKRWE